MKTIVVGVDGSEHADKALDFAAEEAALRGARLLIVAAWQMPHVMDAVAVLAAEWVEGLRREAEALVGEAVERVMQSWRLECCEGRAVEGHPVRVILEQAKAADMIVLGTRGRGGFAGLLLGSVTAQVIHHARCPVVVVRSGPDA